MERIDHQLAEGGIYGALALDAVHAGEGGAFDCKAEMAFARGIIAAVSAVLLAVVEQLKTGGLERGAEAALHFGGDRTGGG